MKITSIKQLNTNGAKISTSEDAIFIQFPKVEHRTRCIAGVLDSKLQSTTIIAVCMKDRIKGDDWNVYAVDFFTGVGMQNRPLYDGEWATILS